MQSEPLVSIILPAYNAERFIAEAVQSVIDQTWKNWELIIVNDGSSDGTGVYLDTLEEPRIRVIDQDNKGVSAARNVALDVVRGEYITFLDADDVLPYNSLDVRVNYLQSHPAVDVVDGIISVRDETLDKELRSYRPYYQGKLLPRLLRLDDRVFFGPFYMLRNRCLMGARFQVDMTHAEDLLFFIVVASKSKIEYGFVDELVYIYRKNDGSAMSNMEGLERGYLQLLEVVRSLPAVSRTDLFVLRWKIAKILFLSWFARGKRQRAMVSLMKRFECYR